MKKIALLLALWFGFSVWSAAAAPLAEIVDGYIEADTSRLVVLPASLERIEDSAFEGTAIETVIIPDSTESIGERAFANNKALKITCVPESVKHIGDNAFEDSFNVTIRGVKGSYAAAWAQMHNISFSQEEPTSAFITGLKKLLQGSILLSFGTGCISPSVQFWQRRKTKSWVKSMRPQDRPELYPINYKFP